MRLIDADALLDTLKFLANRSYNRKLTTSYSNAYKECMEFVKHAPTIDAVPGVGCKDCWYSSVIPEEMQNVGEWHCEYWGAEMHEDDYCSCGKRKEDERYSNPRMDR